MATSTLEARILALEQAVVPSVAKAAPKLTTRQAGYLTAAALALTWISTNVVGLPSWAQGGITVVVTGITAYETAEMT